MHNIFYWTAFKLEELELNFRRFVLDVKMNQAYTERDKEKLEYLEIVHRYIREDEEYLENVKDLVIWKIQHNYIGRRIENLTRKDALMILENVERSLLPNENVFKVAYEFLKSARHLQLIIDGEEFKASKTDAKPYTDAITEGLAFIKRVAVPVTPPVVPTTPPKTSKK